MTDSISVIDSISVRSIGSPQIGIVWNAAVVFQGVYVKNRTRAAIDETLSRNSRILVIVSTYLPSDEEDGRRPIGSFLSPFENACVASGILVFLFSTPPSENSAPNFWRTNSANQNLQRLTSFIGLRYAKQHGIDFCLKIRCDTFLGRQEVIEYLRREVETRFPPIPRDESKSKIRGRIVVTGQCTISDLSVECPPFHVRDHFFFGFTSDLLKFFDMTDQTKFGWRDGIGITTTVPESDLTILWMKSLGIEAMDTRELLARYFVVEDASFVEQVRRVEVGGRVGDWWSVNLSRYLAEGAKYLEDFYSGEDRRKVTTRQQWLAWYQELI